MTEQQRILRDRGICLIIPTYNNAGTIADVVQRSLAQCRDVIVVCDGCTDNTIGFLKEYLENNKVSVMVNIIHMSFFHGLESSMNAGRDLAIGDFIYEFDNIPDATEEIA